MVVRKRLFGSVSLLVLVLLTLSSGCGLQYGKLGYSAPGVGTVGTQGLALRAISPVSDICGQRTPLIIEGGQFTPDVSVTVGGTSCTSLTVISASQLTCVTPPTLHPGSLDVVIRDSHGHIVVKQGAYQCLPGSHWVSMSLVGAPSARVNPSVVWTGSKLIVWGGSSGGQPLNTGAAYDLATDQWSPLSTAGAPSARALHKAVWTGSKMLVKNGVGVDQGDGWYGALFDGASYDPETDSWSPIAASMGATPSEEYVASQDFTAVWTGTSLVTWGGRIVEGSSTSTFDSGARYDTALNTWSQLLTNGAPLWSAAGIWTGSEVLIYGGTKMTLQGNPAQWADVPVAGGFSLDPTSGGITSLPSTPLLDPIKTPLVAWTGARMVVFGVSAANPQKGEGAAYTPLTSSWTALSTTGFPLNSDATGVWTGSKFLVWGASPSPSGTGLVASGGIYDPVSDAWSAVLTTGAPDPRTQHSAVWTGNSMIVWGGLGSDGSALSSGAIYFP